MVKDAVETSHMTMFWRGAGSWLKMIGPVNLKQKNKLYSGFCICWSSNRLKPDASFVFKFANSVPGFKAPEITALHIFHGLGSTMIFFFFFFFGFCILLTKKGLKFYISYHFPNEERFQYAKLKKTTSSDLLIFLVFKTTHKNKDIYKKKLPKAIAFLPMVRWWVLSICAFSKLDTSAHWSKSWGRRSRLRRRCIHSCPVPASSPGSPCAGQCTPRLRSSHTELGGERTEKHKQWGGGWGGGHFYFKAPPPVPVKIARTRTDLALVWAMSV